MRKLGLAVRCLLLVLLVAAPALARAPADDLRQFARDVGLRDVDSFITTVTTLRKDGTLPDRYLTKAAAERAGWKPGDDLCRAAPGKAIGGDRFGNRERRLPAASGRNGTKPISTPIAASAAPSACCGRAMASIT